LLTALAATLARLRTLLGASVVARFIRVLEAGLGRLLRSISSSGRQLDYLRDCVRKSGALRHEPHRNVQRLDGCIAFLRERERCRSPEEQRY
jgi:hypothetical protein